MSSKKLILVSGPTASGKTALAISLAQKYNTEIISADSRQIFRELDIGVARPSPEELSAVQHHFIASHSVKDEMSAGIFANLAEQLLETLFARHDAVVLTGGSGLYIDALVHGFDELPETDLSLREKLNTELKENNLEPLLEELRISDPDYYEQVDKANHRRVLRALEVIRASGKPFSSFRKGTKTERNYELEEIRIELDRNELYARIDRRVDEMMERGLEQEAKSLFPIRHLPALNTVGYKELFDYFDGKISREAAIDKIKQNTRNYAKRQMTWMRGRKMNDL